MDERLWSISQVYSPSSLEDSLLVPFVLHCLQQRRSLQAVPYSVCRISVILLRAARQWPQSILLSRHAWLQANKRSLPFQVVCHEMDDTTYRSCFSLRCCMCSA